MSAAGSFAEDDRESNRLFAKHALSPFIEEAKFSKPSPIRLTVLAGDLRRNDDRGRLFRDGSFDRLLAISSFEQC